jgi:spermidine synthase
LDGRFFVRTTHNRYDVVLIGLSRPSDLSINRLFTQEFFSLAKNRLKPDGILAFYLPGSLSYLSSQLRDLNVCVLNGLQNIYNYVRIIPGDYNIFLVSNSADILEVNPDLVTQRISQRNIKTDILLPAYLNYRFDKRWQDWFIQSLGGATKKVNRDFSPFAVFQMLVLWNKEFSPAFFYILEALGNLDLRVIALSVLLITFVLFLIFYYQRNFSKLSIAYSIATTGFFGMLINLVLIFSFQVTYGYLYHKIGLLISIFMAGIALGSIFMTNSLQKIKNNLSLFVKLEITVLLFSYLAALLITKIAGYTAFLTPIFIILFFIPGLLMGAEFPLASKMYLGAKKEVGSVAGLLYFSDLLGGCVAGILGAVIFLPVLGLFSTCMVIIMVKLSSLILVGIFGKRLTKALI